MADVRKMTGIEVGQKAPEVSAASTADTVIIAAAMLETLALMGGLYWAVTADVAVSMAVRIAVVVAAAVLGGAGVALAVVKRMRSAG